MEEGILKYFAICERCGHVNTNTDAVKCAQCGADLLVMGAYTHSRLRQLKLGGVTRHVISKAPLFVLMCH